MFDIFSFSAIFKIKNLEGLFHSHRVYVCLILKVSCFTRSNLSIPTTKLPNHYHLILPLSLLHNLFQEPTERQEINISLTNIEQAFA